MLDYIEHLQKKPEYVRRRIVWITTVVCVLVIAGVWAGTLRTRLSSIFTPPPNPENPIETAPLFSLKENIESLFKEGRDSFTPTPF
ncbi:MAG: hypothetical protein AAB727_01650 [Patescibacteria group bacterium]